MPAGTIVTVDPVPDTIYLGKDVSGTAFSVTKDHFYGYDETVLGVVRPAAPSAIAYKATALDNEFTRVLWTTGGALTADTTVTLDIKASPSATVDVGIKRPVGILLRDSYFDTTGKYAAEELPFVKGEALYTSGIIAIPYVVAITSGDTYKVNTTSAVGYQAVLGSYPFLVIPYTSLPSINGTAVVPDVYGNYAIGTEEYTIASGGGTVTLPYKVGNVISLDNRMPRQLLDFIQNDPTIPTTGISTGGLYGYLYNFIVKVLTGASADHDISDVKDAVASGHFGLAIINIEIA